MNTVVCAKCKTPRPPEMAEGAPRSPCPNCGATSISVTMVISDSLSILDSYSFALVPGDQERDWRLRWKLIQYEISEIKNNHSEDMSKDSIHLAAQRLFAFFILAYHLKDALKDASSELGLVKSNIENAINSDPRLALLADLANLDKHVKLDKPPRSGYIPTVEEISGIEGQSCRGWRLSVKILHNGSIIDGLTIAANGVDAWRETLISWKLI